MVIRPRARGENVKKVQRALQRNGFDIDDDGDFGPRTERAVKDFQRQHGLNDDGVVGPRTLAALGLDSDTLEELSGTASSGGGASEASEGGGVSTITFTEEDVTVPPVVAQRMTEFVELAVDQRAKILGSLVNGLANFETTMSFASADEATPDAFGAVASKIFETAVDQLVSEVPGLSMAKSFFDAATTELDRAGAASASLRVGSWIKDQRAAADDLMRQVNPDEVAFEVEQSYLDQDRDGREAFFNSLVETIEQLRETPGPDIDALERQLYEQWIDASFRSIGDESDGCIQYRFEYDDEANTFDFESCSVEAPFGDRVETGLNRLLDRRRLPGVSRPIDFKVRKRICLRVENFVGGKSWSCGWLDADNEEIHTPVHPPAQQGLRDPGWRAAVSRFGDA